MNARAHCYNLRLTMATASAARIDSSYGRSRKKRVFLFTFLILVLVIVVAAASGWYWFSSTARAALPQLDGEIKVAGLSAPVAMIRDAQGMPHITAATIDDMLFAQGYVTAQDRLWQMDVNRRFGKGELAAILGPSVLKLDKRHRILQIRATAEKMVAALSEIDR